MRICRYTDGEDPYFGLVDGAGEKIAQISGDPLYTKIELTGVTTTVADVRLLAPVIPRSKVIGIGRNYAEHAREMNNEVPEEPMMFLIPNTAVIGPDDPVVMPPQSERVDYEGELAVIIGRMCRDVSPEDAAKSIFGYTCANDVTARDLIEARPHIEIPAAALAVCAALALASPVGCGGAGEHPGGAGGIQTCHQLIERSGAGHQPLGIDANAHVAEAQLPDQA